MHVWNIPCAVYTEVHWLGTFQWIKALPAHVRSVQYADLAHHLQRHYSGLLRHDPQHSSHWNEGEQCCDVGSVWIFLIC